MSNLLFLVGIVLAFALLLFSICWRGLRNKKIKPVLILGSVAAALALAYFWAFPSWEFPVASGSFEVATVNCTYTDENRAETYENDGSARWLNVGFWYPAGGADAGSCPLVVFSHGSFGVKESNETLYRELASRGYVVCAIDHTYQCLSTIGPNGETVRIDSRFRKEIMAADDSTAEAREALAQSFAEWMAVRTKDINFVLDTVLARAKADDAGENGVYRLIDTESVGVMGHSLGGAAALGVGRMRGDVRAVVSLEAPFMCDVIGVENGDFVWADAAYPVPLLNVYTDSSWSQLQTSPQYAQNAAVLADDSDTTYDLYIEGAGHMTLTDLDRSMPPLCLAFGQEMFFDVGVYENRINGIYADFFDRWLKNDTQADLTASMVPYLPPAPVE